MLNFANSSEIPIGLGMALAQNIDAMKHFSSLSKDDKQQIIDNTHSIHSKKEMQAYVQSLVNQNTFV